MRVPKVVTATAIVGLMATGAVRSQGPSEAIESNLPRRALMWHHFTQVSEIHDAIVRGDLDAVRDPAARLAAMPVPAGLPFSGESFVDDLRTLARRVARARTLERAADSTADMMTLCGDCHVASGAVVDAVALAGLADASVQPMVEHQRAVDEMVQGLVRPSPDQWRRGADRLRASALVAAELPDAGPAAQTARLGGESFVHGLAEQAASANSAAVRAALYAEIVTSCSSCHSEYEGVGGPNR